MRMKNNNMAERNIHVLAGLAKQYTKFGIEYSELFQEAYKVSLEVATKYDPQIGPEYIFVWNCVRNKLVNYTLKNKISGAPETNNHNNNTPEQNTLLKDHLERLSNDAKTLISILFQSPGDIINSVGGLIPGKCRSELVRRARNLHGGSINRWYKAINEIKNEMKGK